MVFAIQCSFIIIPLLCAGQDDDEETINPYAKLSEFPEKSDRRRVFFFALRASGSVVFSARIRPRDSGERVRSHALTSLYAIQDRPYHFGVQRPLTRQLLAQGAGRSVEVRDRIKGEQTQVIVLHSEHGDAGVI